MVIHTMLHLIKYGFCLGVELAQGWSVTIEANPYSFYRPSEAGAVLQLSLSIN